MTPNPSERVEDWTASKGRLGARLIFGALLVFFAVQAWRGPIWEWDLLAYVGCVEELDDRDPAAVHRAVYAELERVAPPVEAEELRSKNDYRRQLAAADEAGSGAFNAQLPFYRGRVLYIGAIAGLTKAGLSPVRAAYWISLIAGIVVGLITYRWFTRSSVPAVGAVLGGAVLVAGGWLQVGAMATPDALAAALLLGGVYLLLEARRATWAVVVLGLCLAVRADHIVLIAPLFLWHYWRAPEERPFSDRMLWATLSAWAVVIVLCTWGRGTYGWWTVYHHTFFGFKTDPAQQTPPLDLGLWLTRTVQSLPMFKAWQPLLFTVVGLAAVGNGWRKSGWRGRATGLAVVTLFGIGLHFVLLPALWPRLFLAHWTLVGLALWLSLRRSEPADASPFRVGE